MEKIPSQEGYKKEITMKRRISLLVLIAMLLCVLPSCSGNAEESTPSDTTATESETAPAETENPYDPHLPSADYDGYTMTFAVRGNEGDHSNWDGIDIVVEELTGDSLNDAIYARNTYMGDTYNIQIAAVFCGDTSVATTGSDMFKRVEKSILGGDEEFAAILTSPYDSIGYALSGYVLDLGGIPHLDFTKPWWNQNVREALTFGSRNYLATGELTIVDNYATHVMIFDKKLATDFSIDDPYADVRNGKWTLDKFFRNASLATTDLDGDGAMGMDDRYGYAYWQDAVFSLLYSTGNSFGSIIDGKPELTFFTDHTVDTWNKLMTFLSSGDTYATYDYAESYGWNIDGAFFSLLANHQILYGYSTIYTVITLRELETEFGILPNPKFDETQQNYITAPHAYGHTMLTVPITVSDSDRTGLLLEAFSAKSAELVTPAFYDKTLIGKSTRDEDSAEMLSLIFGNVHYDIGHFFMWGSLPHKVMLAWNDKKTDIGSIYARAEKSARRDMEKCASLFE